MNFLDNARNKPLSERKRLVWIFALTSLGIIVVAWLTFFNEWKLPAMDTSQSSDLKELADEAKDSASAIKEQISSIKETTEEVKQLAESQGQAETQSTSFTKKDVEVSLRQWRKDNGHGLVTVGLRNLSETPVIFKNFVLRQGFEEISAPLEETLAPQQEKETEIDFSLLNDSLVTAFEIREVSFTPEEAWSYLFAIRDQSENIPETDVTPTPSIAPEETSAETPAE